MTLIGRYNLEFQKYKMADGHHMKTVKSQYFSNGLADSWETWRNDFKLSTNFNKFDRY